MAICCMLLVALSAWMQSRIRNAGPLTQRTQQLRHDGRAAWLCWGAALAGLGYLGLVQLAISSGLAVHTDAGAWCFALAGSQPAPVPYEWIAQRWLLRGLLFALLCLCLLIAAAVRLARSTTPVPAPGLVRAGAGMMLLALVLADRHGFGLHAFRGAAHWLSVALPALALMAIASGVHRWRKSGIQPGGASALSSQRRQSSHAPIAAARPSAAMTHGRSVHGGS